MAGERRTEATESDHHYSKWGFLATKNVEERGLPCLHEGYACANGNWNWFLAEGDEFGGAEDGLEGYEDWDGNLQGIG